MDFRPLANVIEDVLSRWSIARCFHAFNRHDLNTVERVSVYASLAFLIASAMPSVR